MKRFYAILAALLCLCLAGCHRYLPENTGEPAPQPAPQTAPAVDPAAEEPLKLETLNVEFVAEGRDVNELFTLPQTFPDALTSALKKRGVELGKVAVTFGTSDEATAEALQGGAVDLAFLSLKTDLDHGFTLEAIERYDAPDLALSAIAQRGQLPAKFTEALADALPELADALAHYTGAEQGGAFVPVTDEMRDSFVRLYDTGEAVLHTETARFDGREFILDGVGCAFDYGCGIRAIEVRDEDGALLYTIELEAEAGGDLPMEYTQCWEAENAFRLVDVNFDGYDDIEVFGWAPSNTIPYLYWLWDDGAQRFTYSFCMQVTGIDPETKTITVEYKDGPGGARYCVETYEWRDGELALVSREITEP